MPHSSALPALVLNIDCAYRDDPGYDLERRRITAAGAMLRLHPAKTEDEIIAAGRDANILLLKYGNTPLTARVLQNVPSCWALVKYGIGLDNVDIEAATAQGIVVANAPLFCVEEVSDHAVALLLATARRLVVMDRNIRAGGWFDFPRQGALRRLKNLTAGLLGFGNIGRAVARKLSGFGMRILACDPMAAASSVPAHVALVTREELFREADFLSLHVPLTQGTRGLIGEAELRSMKASAILINTSRGAVVDERALVEALRDNRIAGAALDVFTEEPLPVSSPLRSLPNVVLTPHFAAHSEESMFELRSTVAASVEALVRGYWPPHPANPTVSPRIPLQPWTEFHS